MLVIRMREHVTDIKEEHVYSGCIFGWGIGWFERRSGLIAEGHVMEFFILDVRFLIAKFPTASQLDFTVF